MIIETDLNTLYKKTISAFPLTTKRQHSTDTVSIRDINWMPFYGAKTLFLKAFIQNENREYESIILFKNVKYEEKNGKGIIAIQPSAGKRFFVEQINTGKNDVLVKCNCPDFFYRFNYYNSLDKSLFGKKRKKYEGANFWKANPKELPGFCKHLIKTTKILGEFGLLM